MAIKWETEVLWTGRDVVWAALAGFAFGVGLAAVLLVSRASDPMFFSVMTVPFYAGLLAGAYLFVVRRNKLSFRQIGFVSVPRRTIALMVPLCIAMAIVVGI